MMRLIKTLPLVIVIIICLFTLGCSPAATPEESEEPQIPEESEEPEATEELPEDEEESEEESAPSSSQSTTSGSGFTHVVKMEIDGEVEKDKNEGWWESD